MGGLVRSCEHSGSLSVCDERGFSVILWRDGDLGYALASDLNGGDLLKLAALIADQR
jgi:hypothetical protein